MFASVQTGNTLLVTDGTKASEFGRRRLAIDVERTLRVSFSKTLPVLDQDNCFCACCHILTDLNAFRDVNTVTWSPDPKSLASVSNDKTVTK